MRWLVLFLVLVVSSCHNNSDKEIQSADGYGIMEKAALAMDMAPVTRQAQLMPQVPEEIQHAEAVSKQKIIKDGRMNIQAVDIHPLKKQVDALLGAYGAYYANESYNDSEFETSFSLYIRVPADQFEPLVAALENGGGKVIYKDIAARDVTQQHIDLEVRLNSMREYLARYRELLKRAVSVKDILDIEERIRVLMEEIDSTEGRLRYLNDQVSYSSLQLMLIKEKSFRFQPDKRDRIPDRIKQAVVKGWVGLIDILLFLVKLWPVYLTVVIGMAIRRLFRK